MLPLVDSVGRISVSTLPVVYNNRGIGYAADGSMVITPNLTVFDAWVGAWRLDPVGRVCYATTPGPVAYNAGLPFLTATGQLLVTLNSTPGVNDPFVAGARVSDVTGVYLTTSFSDAALIASLFGAGEQGLLYDYSDLTTMYQDSLGTTPVYAPGQGLVDPPVGLVLDKRLGLVRGPTVVTNGDFSNGVASWAPSNNTTSVAVGEVTLTATSAVNNGFTQVVAVVAGKTYELTAQCRADAGNATANSARLQMVINSTFVLQLQVTGNGTTQLLRGIFTAASTVSPTISMAVASTGTYGGVGEKAYFSNIQLRELAGNHETQATAINRPVLSARVNQLLNTEDLTNAYWTKGGCTATAVVATTTTNGALGFIERILSTVPSGAGASALVTLRAGTVNSASVGLWDGSTSWGTTPQTTGQIISGPGTVTRNNGSLFDITSLSSTQDTVVLITRSSFPGVTCTLDCYVRSNIGANAVAGDSLGITKLHIQFDLGTVRYQRVVDPNTYDTVGFPLYAAYNGTNTSLATATGGGGTLGFFLCLAVKQVSGGAIQILWDDHVAQAGYEVYLDATSKLTLVAGNGVAFTTVATAASVPIGTVTLLTIWDDGVNLNAQIGSGSVASIARPVVTAGSAAISIGQSGSLNFFNGQMFPSVYTKDSGLTAAQRLQAQNFVKSKAGL